MGLKKKLQQWQDAGLMSADQAARILSHEQDHKGGRLGRGLAAAALFAILCGVLSIIAANWMYIPASVKIGTHVGVNLLIAFALWRTTTPRIREGLCLLLFGLTLTLIVLIGQVFQFGGAWTGALVFWMVITAPLIALFGETRATALPWTMALLGTIIVALYEHIETIPEFWGSLFMAATALYLPLALIADGNIRFIQRHKPAYADVFMRMGFALLLASASMATLSWYMPRHELYAAMADSIGESEFAAQLCFSFIFLCALLAQTAYAVMRDNYRGNPAQKGAAELAALCTISIGLPYVLPLEGNGPVAAWHFIALWVAAGYIAQEQGWHRLVSLAILLITVRVFVIYCELFGSLMTTGVGLISAGIIMLGLLWGARRLSTYLKKRAPA